MKKNRLVALITIFTMILTSGLGNLGLLLSSYAQDKSNLIIADIFNEEPIPTPDSKLLLDQNIEKISDTELKINLNIKSLSESIDLKNVSLINTLSDSLEIESDSVSVFGIENEKDAKGEVTQPRDTLTIELGDVSSSEVNVSFLAKIRQSAIAGENIALNLKSELKYSLDNEEEGVYNFAIPKINLIENVVEEEVKEEDLSVGEEAVTEDTVELPEVSSQSPVVTPKPEPKPGTVTKPTLETHKKAEDNGNGSFKITLEVKGKPTVVEPKKADIVIMIDSSGSMLDKIDKVTGAAINFSKNILNTSSKDQVKISVAEFSSRNLSTPGGSSSILTDFTSDINKITDSILEMQKGGGTNTEDGIWRVSNLLHKSVNDDTRKGANRYVVFFTDGLPNTSYSMKPDGDDQAFKDAQVTYYDYFTGYGSPTEITIGGLGENPIPQNILVNNAPIYKDVKFYTLGLFTAPEVDPDVPPMTDEEKEKERNTAIQFMSSIQNIIEPSKFADKYYTEDLNAINSIFMDISNDIKASINSTIAKDLVIHDIVTKEFKIKEKSWELTDLKGKEIAIPPDSVTVSKTADGCDDITIRVGDLIANQVDANNNPIGGVRFSFDVETTDPYFSGEGIQTNVSADINYKDPTTNSESSEVFKEYPSVNINPKIGTIKVTKNVKNTLGQIVSDVTPFEIVIERTSGKGDPPNIVPYNKTYELKSTESNDTGELHLIGPKTVSPDGKVILSTDAANAGKYLVAGNYTVKEINIPSGYALKEIKVNGNVINEGTAFNISKDTPNINIEVVNTSTLINNLIKDKTATPVKDKNGNPTGEFEIALQVSTPAVESTTMMHSDPKINYNGYWTEINDSSGGYKISSNHSDYIEFEFEGIGFDWISKGTKTQYTDYAMIRLYDSNNSYLKDVFVDKQIFSSSSKGEATYSLRGLSPGKYKAQIYFFINDSEPGNIISIKKIISYRGEERNIENTTITDIVTQPFNIVKNGYGTGKTAVIEKPSGSPAVDINTTIGKKIINNKTYDYLTWKPIKIDSNGVTIKFKVKPKDIYEGQNNVDTNVEATVEYTDGNTTYKEYFNKPKVNIPFIKGSITIRKDIVQKNNAGTWETVPNNKVNPNDTFSISVVGDQTYTVDLVGNSHQTLNFYLKNTSTNVSYNKDASLNYITKGSYSIKEIVPMNYEQVEIYINTTKPLNTDNPKWVKLKDYSKDGNITIDKDNPHIDIKVTNTLVNESYYQDKASASNIFKYNGVIPLQKLFEKFN